MLLVSYFFRCGFHLYTGIVSSSLSSSFRRIFRALPFPINCTCKVICLSIFFSSASLAIRASNSLASLDFPFVLNPMSPFFFSRNSAATISHTYHNIHTFNLILSEQYPPILSRSTRYNLPQPLNPLPFNIPHRP